MADRIRLLPEVVANQIAAGEVVNRPASVVKEMMENSLDAGAHSVKVNFRDGGKDLIQIIDDGCGMSPIDARMAFDRHATSKIAAVEDIYALHTFGFRGEALASIAAVSQVELRSRQEGDEVGTLTEIHGGEFVAQRADMCPVGSQFMVRNLFYNVPARRRFLDKATTLSAQIKAEFQRVALCNPQVAFELYASDAPVYSLAATSLAGRIVDVVGRHIKQNLLEVSADTTIARIEGYVGRPAAAKKRNSEQYLFVNGRYFKSNYLVSAIMRAYEKLIPEGCQPSYFLYLTIDPARVDVNVHPQKTEVRFADEEAVWQIVNAALRETLGKTGAVPLMDFDQEQLVDIPVLRPGAVYVEPSAMSNVSYNPFSESYIDPSAPDPNVDFAGFDVPYHDTSSQLSDAGATLSANPQRGASAPVARRSAGGGIQPNEEFDDFVSSGTTDFASSQFGEEFGESHFDFISSEQGVQQQIDVVASETRFGEVLTMGGGYLATTIDNRLMLVDARRAHERILYESYLEKLGHSASVSQQLLFPEVLVLSADEYALLEENAVDFASLGFDLDFRGESTVEVKGTPADLPADAIDRLIYDLLQAFSTPVSLAEVRREKIAAVMARGASSTLTRAMDREAAHSLLEQLAQCKDFSFSPSGKPILAEITAEEIRSKLG